MKRSGGCNCGQVRYELEGEPLRVGVCHCENCRKDSGSAFSFFGIWPKASATLSGELSCWRSRAGGERFCPTCGSSLFSWAEGSDEIEIKLGYVGKLKTVCKAEVQTLEVVLTPDGPTRLVVAVGGLGSLKGTLVAAIILGIFDTGGKYLYADAGGFFIYAVAVLVLLVKPAGLYGRE